MDLVPIRRALLSVSDKTGIVELGQALALKSVELLSTGGTAKALRDAGLLVKDVSQFTGFPEMLDGRVKTLHPKIHGGLLGRRDLADHRAAMKQHGVEEIDLVVVNLYPFEKVAGQVDALWDELIENIDIGGPSMLRSGAKNHASVAVVCDPADYGELVASVDTAGGTTMGQRRKWALKVFARTAAYDAAIASRLAHKAEMEGPPDAIDACAKRGMGPLLPIVARRSSALRYGENPHQAAAVYVHGHDLLDLAGAEPLQGKELSYNNLLDADAAIFGLRCLIDGQRTGGAVIIKHNTPCGAARASSPKEAWAQALAGDPVSAFGGIVAFSHTVDGDAAQAMGDVFLEVVVAPGFTDEARAVFAKKANLRLLAIPKLVEAPLPHHAIRSVPGGLLVQEHDLPSRRVAEARVVTKRAPTADELVSLDVAWRMAQVVKSNAITLAKGPMLIGAGAGQTSRVDSARLAVEKARAHGHDPKGAAVGSDAFFPFADGLLVLAQAGVTAVAQPGGSKRDDEVIAAADAHGVAMIFTDERHFRH